MAGGSYEHQRNLDGDLLISYNLWYTEDAYLNINGKREGNRKEVSELSDTHRP